MEKMIREGGSAAVNVSTSERFASILVGTSFLLRGLRPNADRGLVSTLVGLDLIRRGATGHSYLYKLLGVSTAPNDGSSVSIPYRQGIRIDESVTINRSPEELYR